MSDMDKQNLKEDAVPFFARYLEGQLDFIEEISEAEMRTIGGGDGEIVTQKYPSDNEEASGGGEIVTQKYPSDNADVSGVGGIATRKYPSDSDEYFCK